MSRTSLINRRRTYWIAALLALVLIAFAALMHWREGSDAQVVPIALNPGDPDQERVGALVYRGGLDIPRMGQNLGGLSALRWDGGSGRLLALTDDARFVWIAPVEKDGQLTGIGALEVGNLLGLDGEPLTGKEQGDSESLAREDNGPWMVGFERDHRVWVYKDGLAQPPVQSGINPEIILGDLENNGGLEAMAITHDGHLICAERQASEPRANCALYQSADASSRPFPVTPPLVIAELGGVPTDAVSLSGDDFVVLFRSYSPGTGNTASLVRYSTTGDRVDLATLRPPLNVDNFEGLAVREEGGKVFLYIVSDDNFSSNQRTLLMKFELITAAT